MRSEKKIFLSELEAIQQSADWLFECLACCDYDQYH